MAAGFIAGANPSSSAPLGHAELVAPSDSADLSYISVLSIGVAGNVKVTTLGGETLVIAMPVGVFPLWVTRVWSTSTTATGIVAIY